MYTSRRLSLSIGVVAAPNVKRLLSGAQELTLIVPWPPKKAMISLCELPSGGISISRTRKECGPRIAGLINETAHHLEIPIQVTEGDVTTGRFLSGVRLGADGLIASYQVTFNTEHALVED